MDTMPVPNTTPSEHHIVILTEGMLHKVTVVQASVTQDIPRLCDLLVPSDGSR